MESKGFLESTLKSRTFIKIIILVNLLGFIWGIYFYTEQLLKFPWYFWPFIPNCPVVVLYFMIFLYLLLKKGDNYPLLRALAYFGLIKYGLWTVGVTSKYYFMDIWGLELFGLWLSHSGMVLQALLYWRITGLKIWPVGGILIFLWYLFNDYLDYSIGIHPELHSTLNITFARNLSFSLTFLLGIYFMIKIRSKL